MSVAAERLCATNRCVLESLEVVLDVGGLGGLRAVVRELALQAPQRVRVQLLQRKAVSLHTNMAHIRHSGSQAVVREREHGTHKTVRVADMAHIRQSRSRTWHI